MFIRSLVDGSDQYYEGYFLIYTSGWMLGVQWEGARPSASGTGEEQTAQVKHRLQNPSERKQSTNAGSQTHMFVTHTLMVSLY